VIGEADVGGSETFDVLLQGSPFVDLTFTFNDRDGLPALGQEVFAENFAVNPGGVFNIAAALARFGLRVGLLAQLGNDIFSRFIAERMEAVGLSLSLTEWVERPLPVVTAGVSFPHDRLFISYAERDDPAYPPPVITLDTLERHGARALFCYGEHDLEMYREARRRGILVHVDTFWNVPHLHSPRLREVAREASLFSPNLPEALEMTGTGSAEEALQALSALSACVVMKIGGEGCMAACNGLQYRVPALPVTPVDTTGAGDNFNAGMLYGLLQGYPFETALQCANIAGGLSTQVLGGAGNGATHREIEAWLSDLRSAQREETA
jgi:sugar/nucleoside kinase (ribokinase family)